MAEPIQRALLVVDVQNDFCEGGSLAVEGGAACASAIDDHVRAHRDDYALVVASADWHIDPGEHFASYRGTEPDFVDTWPDHCVAGTPGAAFHQNFTAPVDLVVRKGQHAAAYSAFEGADESGASLAALLGARGINSLDVCGIATTHCVRASVLDALDAGLSTRVLCELTVGVTATGRGETLAELERRGARLR